MLRSTRFGPIFGAVAAAAALVGLTLVACGGDTADSGPDGSSARTIEIEMVDIAFSPTRVEVAAGETIRFVFHNSGRVIHDAFIGNGAAQDDLETRVRRDSSIATRAAGVVTVEPGETGELTHTFEPGGELLIGCHRLGHYGEGMKATISVT